MTDCRLKITYGDITGVAVWKWKSVDDDCGICRMSFESCCPNCKIPGDDCPLAWGTCKHCFHLHCIEAWISSQQSQELCPMCRRPWQYKQNGKNGSKQEENT